MKLSFKHFQFDCEQQILTQDGDIIALNEKPAQLLTLFLLNADKIHNKADILQNVWSDRVVTDQVVFQNISYLRALLGSDAIKTFSKKGYQWQLPLVEVQIEAKVEAKVAVKVEAKVETQLEDKLDLITPHESPKPITADILDTSTKKVGFYHSKRLWLSLALVVSITLMVAFWFGPDQQPSHTQRTLFVLESNHHNNTLAQSIKTAISDHGQLNITAPSGKVKNQTLFDSPFRTWQTLVNITNPPNSWVLATRQYPLEKGAVLRFHIQGEHRGWQGYIFDVTQTGRIEQLNQLLDILADSQYFSVKSNHAALAQLTLLHSASPNNLLINHQLVKMHYESGELDRATALAETQLDLVEHPLNHSLDQGLLHLLKAKINMRNDNWVGARLSIDKANQLFGDLNLPQLESLARIQAAWVLYVNKDRRGSMQSLNLAASKARIANEPLQEVQAHLIQSFLAGKVHQDELMHTQLDLAKQLILLHQLGDEHKSPVFFNLARSAPSVDEALPHYLAILALPFSPLYSNYFYTAAERIRETYIAKQQWLQAIETIKPWQRASFAELTRARVAFAKQDQATGIQTATLAFRRAQIDHAQIDALDAALLLLQHIKQDDNLSGTAEYVAYIKQNARHRWLEINQPALEKLALLQDVTDF